MPSEIAEDGKRGNKKEKNMSDKIVEQVRSKYASVAASGLSSDHAGVRAVAEAFGYSPEELASIPAEANMGLSCGNPTAFAHLRPGETVVDLGCGGGLDVLLAARKVGPTGKAIGIDMTPEMIERRSPQRRRSGIWPTSPSTWRPSTSCRCRMPRWTASFPIASSTWPRTRQPSSARCSASSSRADGLPFRTSP